MKKYIVLLLVLGATSEAVGQEIYFIRTRPVRLVKMNADGSGLTTIITEVELKAAILEAIPLAEDHAITGILGDFYVDSVRRKLYLATGYLADVGGKLPVLARFDLDGTNMEVVFNPGTVAALDGDEVVSPQVLQDTLSVPAVSTWGLAVMVLLLGIAATAMIRKRGVA